MDEINREEKLPEAEEEKQPETKETEAVPVSEGVTEETAESKEGEETAAPKKKSKTGPIIAIAIIVLIVACAATFAVLKFLKPALTYKNGVKLMNDGKYLEAVEEFKKLDNYKDEATLINTCYLKNQGEDFYKAITKAKYGTTVKFGHYEQDNDEENGKEPIEWRVVTVDDKNVMLLSKYCLFSMQYNTELADTKWEDCQIRKYLNNEFYEEAFTDDERALIPTYTCEVDITPYNTQLDLKPTKDKVFLISIIDAESYFPNKEDRKSYGTAYARANGCGANKDGTCWWWTRSSGGRLNLACAVYGAGTYTLWGIDVNNERNGIRPAIWIHVE